MPCALCYACTHAPQSGFVNFYDKEALMPFVPLAAKGPWVVTLHGAVVHDNGGYGMLGFGHNADFLSEANGADAVMANLLMPSFAQVRLRRGHGRPRCIRGVQCCCSAPRLATNLSLHPHFHVSPCTTCLRTGRVHQGHPQADRLQPDRAHRRDRRPLPLRALHVPELWQRGGRAVHASH